MSTNKKQLIIGLVGEICSGKDTVALYLKKKYKSETISFSQPLRDILDRIYLPQTRENMSDLGTDLRHRFGQDVLAKTIGEEIKNSNKTLFCLPNIRIKEDIKYLKNHPYFVLINIESEMKTRYERIIKRNQNKDDKTKTWKEFIKDHERPTETKIRVLAKRANYKLDNNGSFRKLYKQVDDIMKELK